MSRYVYRTPDEPLPRSTANDGYNTVHLGAMSVNSPLPTGPCPAWGCGGPERIYNFDPVIALPPRIPVMIRPYPGATSTVPQPPPTSGGSLVVSNPYPPTLSPAPTPTVSVPPGQTAPSLTQPGSLLDSSGASVTTAPFDIGTWLGEYTLFSSLPNYAVVGIAAVAAWMLLGGKQGRR